MSHHQFHQVLPHHSLPGSSKGPLAHVAGTISAVLPSATQGSDGMHMHFRIHVDHQISLLGGNTSIEGQTLFLAVRYGDSEGLPEQIPGLEAGQKIEAQGEYIDAQRAEPGAGNSDPVLPVLHFTHHPVGFIVYQGKRYE